ncbi:MAG: cation acetate symporter [Candidatus Methanofastidiosia archaeon]|jgi:cation/acetate symporter
MPEIFLLGMIFSVIIILVSIAIGIWGRRLTKGTVDYYVAGRTVGAFNNGLAMVSLSLSLTTFLGLTALIWEGFYLAIAVYAAFTSAFVGLLILAAPFLRRHKSFTTMSFIGSRFYSKNLRIISVFIMLVVSVLYLIGNIKGVGIIFELLLGVPFIWGVLIGGLVVTLYVTLGGMYGVTYNQTIQTIILTFALIIPLMMILRGLGLDLWWFPPFGYGEAVPQMVEFKVHYFLPFLVHPVWYIAVFLGSFFGIIGLPHFVMRYFTVRDAKEARWSTVICVLLVGLVNLSVYAMGFAGVYYTAQTGTEIAAAEADELVFILTKAFAAKPYLALAVGGALSAALSTVAGLLLIMGTGLIHDLYGTLRPKVPDKKMLTYSVYTMFAVGVICTIISIRPPEFILVTIMWSFGIAGAAFGVPIVLGIWWKRATKEGCAVAMIVGFLSMFVPYVLIEVMGIEAVNVWKYLYGPLGWVKLMAIGVPLSFILMIVVSWLTKDPPLEVKKQVDMMHGWSDYIEERYNGKKLPIVILVFSVLIMLFVFTLYETFSAIPAG